MTPSSLPSTTVVSTVASKEYVMPGVIRSKVPTVPLNSGEGYFRHIGRYNYYLNSSIVPNEKEPHLAVLVWSRGNLNTPELEAAEDE